MVQPLMGGDVHGAAESSIDDHNGGVGSDAAYVDDEGGEVCLLQEFLFQHLSRGNSQVGLENVVLQSFDDVPGGSDKDGWGIEESEVDGGPYQANSGLEALLGEDAAYFLFELFFRERLDVVALGLEVLEGFLEVIIGMVRVDLEVVYLLGEFEEPGCGFFGRNGRAVPRDGLDGPMPPFIEEVGRFPLEEAPAVGSSGQVGSGVTVSALGDDEDEESEGYEGEGSLHGSNRV